jgi:penicillin-binding protein 1A
VVRTKGDWAFDEFGGSRGVSSLGLEDKVPSPASSQERSSILDLFRR